MATQAGMNESFSIGRVFSRMFGLIKDNLVNVGVFVLILHLISALASYFLSSQMMTNIVANASVSPRDPMAALAIFQSPAYWGLVLISTLAGAVCTAGAVHGYLQSGTGEQSSLAECFNAGLNKFLPLIGLYILWGLGVSLGYILLLIPALILITMWSVTVPALIAEDVGVLGSFGRSRALTKGSRWSIFGLLLVFIILLYVVFFGVLFAIMGTSFASMFTPSASPAESIAHMTTTMLPLTVISGVATGIAIPALLVSLYRELRLVKEGDGPSNLRDIFA